LTGHKNICVDFSKPDYVKDNIFVSFILFAVTVYADGTGTITGTVYDSTSNDPIRGALISLRNTTISVMSDSMGRYKIDDLEAGIYSIIARAKGSSGRELKGVKVIQDSNLQIDIFLETKRLDSIMRKPYYKAPYKKGEMVYVDKPLKSPAFDSGQFIPVEYTCDGNNISPQLYIFIITPVSRPKSLAVVCEDPDASRGTSVHWVIFNISPKIIDLPENVEKSIRPDLGYSPKILQPIQGINDFGKIGYDGPCPPKDSINIYYFSLYALDTVLEFDEAQIQKGITKDILMNAMEGHIINESVLMGKYKR
jgi:Raf kinase inhibitor-like YbhB/YbcL family protein